MNKVDLAHLIMANSYLDTQEADNLADRILSAGYIHKDDIILDGDKLIHMLNELNLCSSDIKKIFIALSTNKSWIK